MSIYENKDFQKCCDIIEKFEEIGETEIMGNCIRELCANISEARDILIGRYGGVVDDW